MQLPGNETHQKILQLLINLFQNDKNIQAFIVFGSLVKGNWDKYSDVDLDVIVKDNSKRIVNSEVKSILYSLTQNGLIVLLHFEEFVNEWVIIFDDLNRVSIRFHLIKDTIPHILGSSRILYGDLKVEEIKRFIIKPQSKENTLEILKDKFIELSIYVPIALHRNQLINAEFFLNKMRNILMEIYTKSREMPRVFDFEKEVDQEIKEKIQSTYTTIEFPSIHKSFTVLVTLFRSQIDKISNNRVKLTVSERLILSKALMY